MYYPQIEPQPILRLEVNGNTQSVSVLPGGFISIRVEALFEEAGELFPANGLVIKIMMNNQTLTTGVIDSNGFLNVSSTMATDVFPGTVFTVQAVSDPQGVFTFAGESNTVLVMASGSVANLLPIVIGGGAIIALVVGYYTLRRR